MSRQDEILKILDLARWAPSGDNTQPWRFKIEGDEHIVVHGFDTRDHVIYDFEGHASHIAHGALLETIRIAASGFGLDASWSLRPGSTSTAPVYDVKLGAASHPDPLFPFIQQRVVQRRPMATTPLTPAQKAALTAAVGPDYELAFFESSAQRRKIAGLLWRNAHIRLTCPEAYEVHKSVIEWGARYSKDRIPEQAVGVDPLTGKLMRWVMSSWQRVEFFNRYLFGTVAPRVQLDVLPALGCAAHLLVRAVTPPEGVEGFVRAGVAMQRLWLTVTALGLHLQPEMTPLIFRWYARAGKTVSVVPEINERVLSLARQFDETMCVKASDAFVFLCRVGTSSAPVSRSLRHEVGQLMIRGEE